MVNLDLSARQLEILEFMKREIIAKGYPPSVREICEGVGLTSTSTVHSHLKTLEAKGYISRDTSKQRAIEIANFNPHQFVDDGTVPQKEIANIPLIGSIAAGQPLLAEEQVEDVYPLATEFLNTNRETFMLRVRGESMIEAGILDGDLIVVEQTKEVRNGDIAALLLEDSATVKYFYQEQDHFRLEPANCEMSAIIAKEVEILGKVIALMRRF